VTMAAGLSIVILTEDSGEDGRATVEALARRMLHLVTPGYDGRHIDFVPREPREEEAMRGNVWKTDGKNPQDHDRRVRLLRYIARRLSQQNTFVLFHIDGDRIWSERRTSENVAKFERLIRNALPQVFDRGRANNPRTKASAQANTDPLPMLQMEHLILLCPFRSIEAWLYQNLRAAIEICRREHKEAHVTELEVWEERREGLDELPAPEEALCLGKAFNLELATSGFPAGRANDVKKSFTESVDRLRNCEALVHALDGTRSWTSSV
jgi:hypothetical protein